VEIEFPNMMSALSAKRVDMGFLTTPFSVEPMKTGQVRALFTEKDAMEGPSELTIIAGRVPYIKANRAALVDYFEDTNRAMRWILDPKNRDAALKLVSDFTKQPASIYAGWIFTKGDDYHAPDSRPDIGAMQKNLDIAKQLGVLKKSIDVKAYADLSLVDEAAARVH
jgi:ABC-type nitrate/sulfonate/bicarbonate transport system substrate-binding protein